MSAFTDDWVCTGFNLLIYETYVLIVSELCYAVFTLAEVTLLLVCEWYYCTVKLTKQQENAQMHWHAWC